MKNIDIALQGGGAHGAFTWGVLDYLLEDGRLNFASVTAASAGAMNAAVMAYGLHLNGPDEARNQLEIFWKKVSEIDSQNNWLSKFSRNLFPELKKYQEKAQRFGLSAFLQSFSPYQFNPFDVNPLRDIIENQIDFEALRCCQKTRLYISATNVKTGKVKVFKTHEITSDTVLASACLPHLFKAVKIDNEYYWDGGYSGNPPLWPLFYDHETQDVLVVHINPMHRNHVPQTSFDIQNRMNEISFNMSLLKEMRAVAFVQKLINEDMLKPEFADKYSNILFHSIRADKVLEDLSSDTKLKTDWDFLLSLKARGRVMAEQWLTEHYEHVGRKSTVDLREEFLELSDRP